MSYTIKSLQKALDLLENEFQELEHHIQNKNHIHDMYTEFQDMAKQLSEKQQLLNKLDTSID